MTCRICGSQRVGAVHRPREMMHGLREVFEYFECADCGCLQITEVPADMSRYYPDDYYSIRAEPRLRRWLKDQRLSYVATGKGLAGAIASRTLKREQKNALHFFPEDVPRSARVLEIGCGRGYLVEELFLRGYRDVRGIDPFMPDRATRTEPFALERKSVIELAAEPARFDLIYLSHSLEHVFDQHEAIAAVARLLSEEGSAVICIPWLNCDAWEIYGTDWVQLDAPRHFYLHSRKSLELLLARAGLEVQSLHCDSTALQFWGSEQYLQDIPLFAANSWVVDHGKSVFSKAQVDDWEARAQELNERERGDQVVVQVRKT